MLTARKCFIPVFDCLLPPEHDDVIVDLLFELATWHALAKLRLHTDDTITALEESTTRLGECLRHFKATTCETYITVELPREEAARGRRTAALKTSRSSKPPGKSKAKHRKSKAKRTTQSQATRRQQAALPTPSAAMPASAEAEPDSDGPRVKEFNLSTYKLHALGDYASAVRRFGTTDNYSTQIVSTTDFPTFLLMNRTLFCSLGRA